MDALGVVLAVSEYFGCTDPIGTLLGIHSQKVDARGGHWTGT
jgi:hypothetical protein